MISSVSSIGSDWFLDGITNLQRQQVKTQRQISSGFRVADASDAPSQAAALVDLGSHLASAKTYQSNLGRIQTEVNTAEQAVSSVTTLLDNARSLATQGASSGTSATDRQYLAVQVRSLVQETVTAANTSVEGRFVFGGDQDQSPPYAVNSTSVTGVDRLTAAVATRTIVNPDGQSVYRARTALTIFDHSDSAGVPASDNVFAALQGLATALQSNDSTGITNSIESLKGASDWLNQQQAAYGTDTNHISAEQNRIADSITSLQSRISDIRDTDVAQAATDLSLEQTAQSAAFGAQAKISQRSLFDYLG